jgi:hypothetical protein
LERVVTKGVDRLAAIWERLGVSRSAYRVTVGAVDDSGHLGGVA